VSVESALSMEAEEKSRARTSLDQGKHNPTNFQREKEKTKNHTNRNIAKEKKRGNSSSLGGGPSYQQG